MSATRRDFLRYGALAGARALSLRIPLVAGPADAAAPFAPEPVAAHRRATGASTLVVARSEMGQGVRTSLAMILAEELEADWSTVSIEQASPVAGLRGHEHRRQRQRRRRAGRPLRKAGAAAREMLIDAAAGGGRWIAGSCRAEKGDVIHAATGRRLGLRRARRGRLEAAGAERSAAQGPEGLPSRRDARAAASTGRRSSRAAPCTGSTRGSSGMRFAAIARCPVAGGSSCDVRRREGEEGGGRARRRRDLERVAVVADDSWAALSGRDALEVSWDEGANAALSTRRARAPAGRGGRPARPRLAPSTAIPTRRSRGPRRALRPLPRRVRGARRDRAGERDRAGGRTVAARSGRRRRIRSACSARWRSSSASIRGKTSRVHVTLIGGGFGRRLGADYAVEAVEVARAAGRTVQVVWSRPDEFPTRSPPPGRAGGSRGRCRRRRADRRLDAPLHDLPPLDVRRLRPERRGRAGHQSLGRLRQSRTRSRTSRVEWTDIESPLATGAWRSVFYPPNVFARECLMDEIAHRRSARIRSSCGGACSTASSRTPRGEWIGPSCAPCSTSPRRSPAGASPLPKPSRDAAPGGASRATSTTAARSRAGRGSVRRRRRATCASTGS